MQQTISCLTMQTPFTLNFDGEEHLICQVTTRKAETFSGTIDKVEFHIVGNPWIKSIELPGHSLVVAYKPQE